MSEKLRVHPLTSGGAGGYGHLTEADARTLALIDRLEQCLKGMLADALDGGWPGDIEEAQDALAAIQAWRRGE